MIGWLKCCDCNETVPTCSSYECFLHSCYWLNKHDDMRSIWTSHSEKKDNMVFPPMLHCSFNVGIPTVANSLSLSSCSMLCSAVYKKLHIWSEVTAGEELFTYSLLHAPTGSASPPPPFPPPPPSIADLTVKGSYSCSCRASTAASLFLKKYPQKTAITSFYCLLVSICCPNESGGESPWRPPPLRSLALLIVFKQDLRWL